MNILIVNAGSSSLKYQLIDTKTETVFAKGICERIGSDGALIDHRQLVKGLKIVETTRGISSTGALLFRKDRYRFP